MAMAQKDRNMKIAQKAFEMVDKMYGKSPKITPPPYVPRDDRFERVKGRAISCDEAARLYGGVLIKEFR
ncbi:hypothetical protein EUTSA_v10026734mg [Eutrema salsugineum]|uniref:Uncharacterized protein n=1 Tax=Eutrema salsugineum TaxID=72664 RepID=V4P8A6_EUTSA|nr:uncharacterized protein LOC18028557 [Eutrema salsugineum]ESQ55856.1 hypothetical protein EUTSA_v10026734mg [Eutrema salsugineum]